MPDVDKMSDQPSKPRIYLDTSAPSHLFAPDVPMQMADTWRLWADIRANEYDAFISAMVADELEATAYGRAVYQDSAIHPKRHGD
jgi:hypothetical protein